MSLLQALWTFQGEIRTGEQLAAEAWRIELDILGKPMGIQDAYFSALGGVRQLTFGPQSELGVNWRSLDLAPDRVNQLSNSLLLFYTHRTRKSSSILERQVRNIPDRLRVLDELRDLALEGTRCLETAEFERFGRLLPEGWVLKTQMADGITDKAIDDIYEAALEAGATGGKIAGAGGGGFLLLYCPLSAQDRVRARLNGTLREVPFHFDHDGSRIVFNVRRDPYF